MPVIPMAAECAITCIDWLWLVELVAGSLLLLQAPLSGPYCLMLRYRFASYYYHVYESDTYIKHRVI